MAKGWTTQALAERFRENPGVGIHPHTIGNLTGAVTTASVTARSIKTEYDLQLAAFAEFDRLALAYPEYNLIYAVPNGQYRPGQRMEAGLKSGVPDISWDWPSAGYHGMRIELKIGRNKLSADQESMIARLREAGYYVVAIWDDLQEIINQTEAYRKGNITCPAQL